MQEKKHLLILGAGFSKAVAGAPTTNEMFQYFKRIHKRELSFPGNERRTKLFDQLMDFVDIINQNLCLTFPKSARNRIAKEYSVESNFEALATYIDLNLEKVKSLNDKNSLEIKTLFSIGNRSSIFLEECKKAILTYLHLVLFECSVQKKIAVKLKNYIESLLNEANLNIITFNYDLALERFLYTNGLWYPNDGYFMNISHLSSKYQTYTSKIKICKPHGSINWMNSKTDEFNIFWYDVNNMQPLFEGWGKKITQTKFLGTLESLMITPSYIKNYENESMLKLWKTAKKLVSESNEITIIGYSLPEQDSAAMTLLNLPDNSNILEKVTCINPIIEKNKFNRLLNREVTIIKRGFEEYLNDYKK